MSSLRRFASCGARRVSTSFSHVEGSLVRCVGEPTHLPASRSSPAGNEEQFALSDLQPLRHLVASLHEPSLGMFNLSLACGSVGQVLRNLVQLLLVLARALGCCLRTPAHRYCKIICASMAPHSFRPRAPVIDLKGMADATDKMFTQAAYDQEYLMSNRPMGTSRNPEFQSAGGQFDGLT